MATPPGGWGAVPNSSRPRDLTPFGYSKLCLAIGGPTWIWRWGNRAPLLVLRGGFTCRHFLPSFFSPRMVQPRDPRLPSLQGCDTSPGHQDLTSPQEYCAVPSVGWAFVCCFCFVFFKFHFYFILEYSQSFVSDVQQSDSVIHIHCLFFFRFFSIVGYYKILSIFSWATH